MTDWISVQDQPFPIEKDIIVLSKQGQASSLKIPFFITDTEPIIVNGINLDDVTHWTPFTPPKKKRWMPKIGENFYEINGGFVIQGFEWENIDIQNSSRNFLGVYKTEAEGKEMYDAIAKFVTERIGEP